MYTLWMRQYLLATQTSVDLLSNVYVEWSKGIARLATIGLGLPVSDEHFDDVWIDKVFQSDAVNRAGPHVTSCAASLYSRHDFNLLAESSNAPNWIACVHGD